MAEKEGFEPPRRFRPPGFQDRSLQPDLGISPMFVRNELIIPYYKTKSQVKNLIFYHLINSIFIIIYKMIKLITKYYFFVKTNYSFIVVLLN